MALIMFFAIGVVEMFIVALWTRLVSGSQVIASGIVTFVNTILYIYVLEALLTNIHDAPLIAGYALGSALGTMLAATPKFEHGFKYIYAFVQLKMQRKEHSSPIRNEPEPVV